MNKLADDAEYNENEYYQEEYKNLIEMIDQEEREMKEYYAELEDSLHFDGIQNFENMKIRGDTPHKNNNFGQNN